jgi:hypothetical protein
VVQRGNATEPQVEFHVGESRRRQLLGGKADKAERNYLVSGLTGDEKQVPVSKALLRIYGPPCR